MSEHSQSEAVAPAKYQKLNEFRQRLSELQKRLIQETWQTYLDTGKWALLRPMYSQHEKPIVVRELSSLSGLLFEEEDYQAGNRLRLLLPCIFLTKDGLKYQDLIERYFRFQYGLFKTEFETREIKSAEIETKLGLTKEETKLLGHLLNLGNSIAGYMQDFSTWSVRTMTEAEDFLSEDLSSEVEKWVLRYYRAEDPVFIEEKRRKQQVNPLQSALLASRTRQPLGWAE
jgi:hypothetical protein